MSNPFLIAPLPRQMEIALNASPEIQRQIKLVNPIIIMQLKSTTCTEYSSVPSNRGHCSLKRNGIFGDTPISEYHLPELEGKNYYHNTFRKVSVCKSRLFVGLRRKLVLSLCLADNFSTICQVISGTKRLDRSSRRFVDINESKRFHLYLETAKMAFQGYPVHLHLQKPQTVPGRLVTLLSQHPVPYGAELCVKVGEYICCSSWVRRAQFVLTLKKITSFS